MANKNIILVKKITEKLLDLMKIDSTIDVVEDKDNDSILVKIDAPKESGLIIGSRGRTLNSLQVILGMIHKKQSGEWKRVIVDISGWRDKEKVRLENLASLTAQRAKETGESQYLYNLSSSQRRVIHLFLAELPEIRTESQGEGKDRFLVVTSNK